MVSLQPTGRASELVWCQAHIDAASKAGEEDCTIKWTDFIDPVAADSSEDSSEEKEPVKQEAAPGISRLLHSRVVSCVLAVVAPKRVRSSKQGTKRKQPANKPMVVAPEQGNCCVLACVMYLHV